MNQPNSDGGDVLRAVAVVKPSPSGLSASERAKLLVANLDDSYDDAPPPPPAAAPAPVPVAKPSPAFPVASSPPSVSAPGIDSSASQARAQAAKEMDFVLATVVHKLKTIRAGLDGSHDAASGVQSLVSFAQVLKSKFADLNSRFRLSDPFMAPRDEVPSPLS